MTKETLYESLNHISDQYIAESADFRRSRRFRWQQWCAAAACLCILCAGRFALSRTLSSGQSLPPIQEQPFVSVSSLLVPGQSGSAESAEETARVPIQSYTGVYVKISSANREALSRSVGTPVPQTDTWYAVSGHTDLQYLIQSTGSGCSLWKFKCFDSDEYPYRDVLALIYQVDSAQQLTKIVVKPAAMDNTETGQAIQAEIGTRTVTDPVELEMMYEILSSLTCYGENHWDLIDYGSADAPSDGAASSHEAVRLGRSLSLITDCGNEIDGLKYTAVSHMFYEFSGIAYCPLSEEQAAAVCEILHIEEPAPPIETAWSHAAEHRNGSLTPEYMAELQAAVTAGMRSGELSFVSSSTVCENPCRLHVVVSSDAEQDLAKLSALDPVGGALEIEYNAAPILLESE